MAYPQSIEPIKLARNHTYLEFDVPLNECARLEAITPQAHVAKVQLRFGIDDDQLFYIKGNLSGQVEVICQRCNLPFIIQVDTELSLSPVLNDGQAKSLPIYYDPILMQEDLLDTIALIEDELLLALPMIPKHENTLCQLPNLLE